MCDAPFRDGEHAERRMPATPPLPGVLLTVIGTAGRDVYLVSANQGGGSGPLQEAQSVRSLGRVVSPEQLVLS